MIETWVLVLAFKYGVVTLPVQFNDQASCITAARNVITIDGRYPQGVNDILTYYSGYCVPIKGKVQ